MNELSEITRARKEVNESERHKFVKELQSITGALFNSPDGKVWLRLYKQHVGFYRNETDQSKGNPQLTPMYCARKDVIKFVEECLNNRDK